VTRFASAAWTERIAHVDRRACAAQETWATSEAVGDWSIERRLRDADRRLWPVDYGRPRPGTSKTHRELMQSLQRTLAPGLARPSGENTARTPVGCTRLDTARQLLAVVASDGAPEGESKEGDAASPTSTFDGAVRAAMGVTVTPTLRTDAWQPLLAQERMHSRSATSPEGGSPATATRRRARGRARGGGGCRSCAPPRLTGSC
jgi:hypothetical protein